MEISKKEGRKHSHTLQEFERSLGYLAGKGVYSCLIACTLAANTWRPLPSPLLCITKNRVLSYLSRARIFYRLHPNLQAETPHDLSLSLSFQTERLEYRYRGAWLCAHTSKGFNNKSWRILIVSKVSSRPCDVLAVVCLRVIDTQDYKKEPQVGPSY